ncbi:MAG: hypothetical protein ACLGPL_08745 [Acidobacteriota bacterium]
MKIDDFLKTLALQDTSEDRKKATKEKDSVDFASILSDESMKTEGASARLAKFVENVLDDYKLEAAKEPEAVDEANPTTSALVYPSSSGNDAAGASEALSTLQASLDKLESVGQTLASGSADLKQVDGTINSLSDEVNGIQDSIQSLAEDDPLRQIGDEASVLAYVESIKWKRGDYL